MHALPVISSANNPVFKKLMALHTARGIRQHGEFLVAGRKLIAEVPQHRLEAVSAWITPSNLPQPRPELKQIHRVLLAPELFHKLNVFGTPGGMITLRLPDLPAFQPTAPWPEGCTLFIPFGDPENVGAAIRAAAALGAARVVLLREAACPFLPRAVRASAGAIWKIRLEAGPALAKLAAVKARALLALDLAGEPLQNVKPPECYGLIAGMEGQGLSQELRQCCRRVCIPMANGVESLNAAVALAIALWAWR